MKDHSLVRNSQIKEKEGLKGREMTDIQKKIMATEKTQFGEDSKEEEKEDRHGQSLMILKNEESLEMQSKYKFVFKSLLLHVITCILLLKKMKILIQKSIIWQIFKLF